MEIVDRVGYCRFCGQSRVLQAPEHLDQDKVDELVTQNCKCDDAKVYLEEMQRKEFIDRMAEEAVKNTHKLFDEDWKEVAQLFCAAARSVAEGTIRSISVSHSDLELSAKMARKNGTIQITRKDAHTQVVE